MIPPKNPYYNRRYFLRTLLTFTEIIFTEIIFTEIIIHAKASSVRVMSLIIICTIMESVIDTSLRGRFLSCCKH